MILNKCLEILEQHVSLVDLNVMDLILVIDYNVTMKHHFCLTLHVLMNDLQNSTLMITVIIHVSATTFMMQV